MSRMSFMEWVGLFIVIIVLLDFFQNGSHGLWGDLIGTNKQSVSKKSAHE